MGLGSFRFEALGTEYSETFGVETETAIAPGVRAFPNRLSSITISTEGFPFLFACVNVEKHGAVGADLRLSLERRQHPHIRHTSAWLQKAHRANQ